VDAALVAFRHIEGAEHAFASAEERTPGASWLQKAAFVEVHRNGRIVVRGTIAVGLALGPPGWAVGLVAGGTVGGLEQASHIPNLKGPAFDEIRKDVPENSSAVVVVADSADVDTMVAAFADTSGRLTRYHLSPEAYTELESAVATFPPAATGPA
jgi:Protein of unknown function (DUF1269)